MRDLHIEGFSKEYWKLAGTYQFEGEYPGSFSNICVTITVYESSKKGFYAKPDIGIRDRHGNPEYADRWGATERDALKNSLEELKTLLHTHYPNTIPEQAFIYRTAENLEEEREINARFPRKIFTTSWRDDKVQRHCKEGAYLEFQLERDGSYIDWSSESIFVGNAVFDPVYPVFCRKPHDFDPYGTTLFTLSELPQLDRKLLAQIELLQSLSSISEYVDNVASMYAWIHEPGKPVWKELRDSIVEFLAAVHEMIEQGRLEHRALFVLGI